MFGGDFWDLVWKVSSDKCLPHTYTQKVSVEGPPLSWGAIQSRHCTRTTVVTARALPDLEGALSLSCLGALQGKNGRVV